MKLMRKLSGEIKLNSKKIATNGASKKWRNGGRKWRREMSRRHRAMSAAAPNHENVVYSKKKASRRRRATVDIGENGIISDVEMKEISIESNG